MSIKQQLQRRLPPPLYDRVRTVGAQTQAILDILRPGEYIFFQSHMRAYTTLTSHILATNPAIRGYTEMHRSYRHDADLVMLRHQAQAVNGVGIGRSRYVLDKLLHNGNTVGPDVAGAENVKQIFSLRPPELTIPSILRMVGETGERLAYSTPEGAARYYTQRVERLPVEAARTRRSFYFDSESLVEDTDRVLRRLTTFLELEQPLASTYSTFAETGKEGAGDPSEHIHSGTIVRERRTSNIMIPEKLFVAARSAYENARRSLLQTCDITVTISGTDETGTLG